MILQEIAIVDKKIITNNTIPHPFPYQGSKRNIAKYILPYFPDDVECLIEPFCGAGAMSIAAAAHHRAQYFFLNDLNTPLMDLWQEILNAPEQLVSDYESLWLAQHSDKKKFFFNIRDEFNRTHKPHYLLYLLARIVKGAVRYNAEGEFNQSADNRRAGMRPQTMQQKIMGVSHLLAGKTDISAKDFRHTIKQATSKDLIYMDPPYQGTSNTKDNRYYEGLHYDEFVATLESLNKENISYIISYDGYTGKKSYGKKLPASLALRHLFIHAGRSSQATLLGNKDKTVESLYLSPALLKRLHLKENNYLKQQQPNAPIQQELLFL